MVFKRSCPARQLVPEVIPSTQGLSLTSSRPRSSKGTIALFNRLFPHSLRGQMIGALIDWLCWKPDDLHTNMRVAVTWTRSGRFMSHQNVPTQRQFLLACPTPDVIQSDLLSLSSRLWRPAVLSLVCTVVNLTLRLGEGLKLDRLVIFCACSLCLSLMAVPASSLCLPQQPQAQKGTGSALPPSPLAPRCVTPPPCAPPVVPIQWRERVLPDRMPGLLTALHPLLPITTTTSSSSSRAPALADASSQPPRLPPAPFQHGG